MDLTKHKAKPAAHIPKAASNAGHVPGTHEGNELVQTAGREAGRRQDDGRPYRSARDSSSVNPEAEEPILPSMPNIPPA